VSALYGYSWPGQLQPQSASPVTPVTPPPAGQPDPTATPGATTRTAGAHTPGVRLVSHGPVRTPVPAPPHRPGFSYIDSLWIGGRSVDVYIPGVYDLAAQRRFPVIYFLHGYPGNDAQWLGSGAQLPGVLDQMIATGQMPPVIAVMPDGNGQVLSDAEWGDDASGDHVERWLTTQVVPAIDGRYRTLGATCRGIAGVSAGGFDFVAELATMGWTPVQSEVVTGGHGWEAWRAEMVDSLRRLRTLWGVAPGVPVATPSPSPSASPPASTSPSPSPTP
jgi:S-formylglutathione hydrolase FrmB